MSEWVATERIAVAVLLADGEIVRGELHLQNRVARHDGPERLLEMLNRPDAFMPLSGLDGGVTFLSKAQVMVVSCATADLAEGDPARLEAAVPGWLDVRLPEAQYVGQIRIELPPTRTRALDYLNTAGRFFALTTDVMTRYVNSDYVRSARPLD